MLDLPGIADLEIIDSHDPRLCNCIILRKENYRITSLDINSYSMNVRYQDWEGNTKYHSYHWNTKIENMLKRLYPELFYV